MNATEFTYLRNAYEKKLHNTDSQSQHLLELGFIDADLNITDAGLNALEPYKVDNAVIMAAGMASRFAPLSFEKPKGLLLVKDEILIERQIKQLQAVGITDITLVLGYKYELFEYLGDKFNVNIVINHDFNRYNNTSTLMLVLDKLKNTYICSSDNYFTENVFHAYELHATYPVVKHEVSEAGEYYVSADADGKILDVVIGEGTWCMLGHVYYDRAFSTAFSALLVQEYEKLETRENLWEKLYIQHIDAFDLRAKQYEDGIIQEFDALHELQQFDARYLETTDSPILNEIMTTLNVPLRDIQDIDVVKESAYPLAFNFSVHGVPYLYEYSASPAIKQR
ncbi:sugar phosphate nucleotidyltransferase [Erysipelothrix anatis]|uniref:sugar phosphate nucleotidyltransferase n=1 Tax=Erysipelothrix anatis TaxID=2683713 RepID=UPI0013567A3E|nr:sugar phosphate nucleotidyltransferase [Erysipelothrix anatis]